MSSVPWTLQRVSTGNQGCWIILQGLLGKISIMIIGEYAPGISQDLFCGKLISQPETNSNQEI